METMLIIGIIAIVALLLRPAPQTQVIYVPLAAEEARVSASGSYRSRSHRNR